MDDTQFDGLTRRINTAVSRRTGIFGALAGFAAVATRSASARVDVPPDCRGTGTQCTDGSEGCSGRCIPKADCTMRCARTASNRKKGGGGKNGNAPLQCTVCASGCPFTSIESAVAAAAPGAVVTVGPGTYVPEWDGSFSTMIPITKDLTLRACDPDRRPLIMADDRTRGRNVFYVSAQANDVCVGTITVEIDGFDFVGSTSVDAPGSSVLVASCDTNWTLRNSSIRGFGSTPAGDYDIAPVQNFANGRGLIDTVTFADCVASNSSLSSAVTVYSTITDVWSELEIRDSVFTDNAGAPAIRLYNYARVTLSGSTTLRRNTSSSQNRSAGVHVGASDLGAAELIIRGRTTIHDNVCPDAGCGVTVADGSTVTGATAGNTYDNISTSDNACPDIYLFGASDPCPF